ncbi:alanine dehydrogenase [Pontibacter sp. G13]|uniref:alanine dehydrogenase n=1 Tax=Pontibacter sp. G13 TaxID=3074898 RepID=UPI0028897806|nr:alanine dehydrogenase [Pontibacter sp. G13]WNJ18002.1 alanine dehydrogenase [Pontibacter sp. G13]
MGKREFSLDRGLFSDVFPGSWAMPQELAVKSQKTRKSLRIGVPKETFYQENRVAITPDTVGVLVANGHQVFIEHEAGKGARYADTDFSEEGAVICYKVEDVFKQADIILKVSPLSKLELNLLRENQVLFSAVNLGSLSPDYLNALIKKNITAIGFEFYRSSDGSLPLVQMMSEIAGVSSIHIASELLTGHNEGQGILLGGITGIPPAEITIVGAGTVGFNAAQTAMGMGARVRIIDEEIYKLRRIEKELGINVYTSVAQRNYIREAVIASDVVIGAAYREGQRAPMVVSEDMIKEMKDGAVIIDVSIDQGGCIETSRVSTHDQPTFVKHGVIHYCVPNIASRVARTASIAISNILGPLLVQIGDSGGLDNLVKYNDGLKQGIYIYRRHLTKKNIANLFGMSMNYRDIELLIVTM